MSITQNLNDFENQLYGSIIKDFFNTSQNADNAKLIFKNPTIAANLRAAAAFIDAALALIEFENGKENENGNNQNPGNPATTFKN